MRSVLTATEYRLLVDHSPVMIWRARLDAKCDYFNDVWLAYTGRTLEQEYGDGWAEGVHPDDLQRCVAYYLDHFGRREAFEMEYRLKRHDGVYRWIFDRGVPYTNDAGEFAGFIGSCVDIEDRKRAQAEFEQWILAIVSHDIRNPLGAIAGGARLLAMRTAGDEQLHTITDRIQRSASRITHIVGDLLDLSRERHGGGIPVVLAETDLHAICREVADEIGSFTSGHPISVECHGSANGMWDPRRLTQAVSNLVGNAVKHGAAGKPVDVRIGSSPTHAYVEVHNDGAIPGDIMPTLFQPFSSRGDDRRHRDGLGLGLYIARSIARAHRGDLEVASTPETGTTFRLVLPRAA